MGKHWIKALLLGVCMLTALPATAHLRIVDPPARTIENHLRGDFCGGAPPTAPMAQFVPGSTVALKVQLAEEHSGLLRSSISQDHFETRMFLTNIATRGEGDYLMYVTIPDDLPFGHAAFRVSDGTYVSCTDVMLVESLPFSINAGLNDVWINPETGGQGFLIIVFPEIKTMFLAWFTYDTEHPPEDAMAIVGKPGHRWLTAQGPIQGKTAMLDIIVSNGGLFDNPEAAVTNSEPGSIGTMEVEFENCARGVVRYDMPGPDLAGEVPIQRVALDNEILCEALLAP